MAGVNEKPAPRVRRSGDAVPVSGGLRCVGRRVVAPLKQHVQVAAPLLDVLGVEGGGAAGEAQCRRRSPVRAGAGDAGRLPSHARHRRRGAGQPGPAARAEQRGAGGQLRGRVRGGLARPRTRSALREGASRRGRRGGRREGPGVGPRRVPPPGRHRGGAAVPVRLALPGQARRGPACRTGGVSPGGSGAEESCNGIAVGPARHRTVGRRGAGRLKRRPVLRRAGRNCRGARELRSAHGGGEGERV
mmetsp:Transcript_42896/g.121357  ORF Transcript_42896/g.121357 Transcript_42896/m.121357 type:complete len:246 (-) Transcript_42896:453-1190(-)